MDRKFDLDSNYKSIVAWKALVGACLIVICANGLTVADGFDQESFTFFRGETATITFDFDEPLSSIPYFTICHASKTRPFCINGKIDENHKSSEDEKPKFSVGSFKSGQNISLSLIINSVCLEDEGTYILHIIPDSTGPRFMSKRVTVLVPPGPADCYQRISGYEKKWVEIHCEAESGNIESIISCFQKRDRIPYNEEITDNGVKIRGVFWYTPPFPVRCCSHAASDNIGEESCRDYSWPPVIAHTTDQPTKNNQRDHSDDEIDIITSKLSDSLLSSGQESVRNVQLVTVIFPVMITLFY